MSGAPAPVAARDGATFVSLVNEYRANARLGAVELHATIDDIAVKRANQMAAADDMEHDLEYVKKRLDAANICWQRLGEIIAWNTQPPSTRVQRFVDQWYGSTGHRAIMLGSDYTHAGGSWTTASSGRHYAAMIFVKLCNVPVQSFTPDSPFSDIGGTKFYDDIIWVSERGLIKGCGGGKFCPTVKLRRGELAGALAAALNPPPTSNDYFSDDEGHRFEDAINRLKAAGLVKGCGGGKFCPGYAMRRGTLAADLAHALSLPRTGTDFYSDDNRHRHEGSINRLAAAKMSVGCGGGTYCPEYRVSRELAARFLRRAFD